MIFRCFRRPSVHPHEAPLFGGGNAVTGKPLEKLIALVLDEISGLHGVREELALATFQNNTLLSAIWPHRHDYAILDGTINDLLDQQPQTSEVVFVLLGETAFARTIHFLCECFHDTGITLEPVMFPMESWLAPYFLSNPCRHHSVNHTLS